MPYKDPEQAKACERRRHLREAASPEWKAKRAAYMRTYWLRLRSRCIEAYGGACKCCGETQQVFLDFDHVNGGGSKLRRDGKHHHQMLYRLLIKENFPDTFQLLCKNCNWAKYRLGKCPHQVE